MDTKRKAILALGLIVVWGWLAYWQWGAMPEPIHVPLVHVSGSAAPGRRSPSQSGELRVNLELLASAQMQRETTFTAPRNIFAVPLPDGTLPVAGGAVTESPASPVSEEALQQQVAMVEMTQYRYLGFVRMGESTDHRRTVAILSKNDEVIVGRAGQHLEPHLLVKAVTPESVTLRDTQVRVDHVVSLTEDVSLADQPEAR